MDLTVLGKVARCQCGIVGFENLSRICEPEMVLKTLLKSTKTALCNFRSPSSYFAIVSARRLTVSKVFLAFLFANWF